ncbi:hypothetical protein J6590_034750 [Homalodisca vitripennis]|nr:hypothetical protein J6590_034750 [Homalodisca vitripennis]
MNKPLLGMQVSRRENRNQSRAARAAWSGLGRQANSALSRKVSHLKAKRPRPLHYRPIKNILPGGERCSLALSAPLSVAQCSLDISITIQSWVCPRPQTGSPEFYLHHVYRVITVALLAKVSNQLSVVLFTPRLQCVMVALLAKVSSRLSVILFTPCLPCVMVALLTEV